MHTRDNIRFALRALRDNKLRTALTTLGVIIGVSAVVAATGIGQSAFGVVLDSVGGLGTNLLFIIPGNAQVRFGPGTFTGGVTSLTLEDGRAILDRTQGLILRMSPWVRKPMQVTHGSKKWLTSVMGVLPEFQTVNNHHVAHGRFITAQESEVRARVAVIGRTLALNLFGSADAIPIGEEIEINRVRFTIIGVLEQKGALFGQDQDDIVMVPLQTAMRRVLNQNYLNFVSLECKSPATMDLAAERIGYLLRRRHRLQPPFPDNDDFTIRSQASALDTLKIVSGTLTALLGSIAAISLTVGGIGIMNIMLVSVTERTREIGIRKALGATRRIILQQFLVESALISLLGGVIGILLGVGLIFGVSRAFGWKPVVDIGSLVIAVVVSVAIGIFFGLWPAQKAAKLHPIEALRKNKGMHAWDNIRFALRALRDNKMRTGLTALGVIIGVAAVVAAIGIGQSAFGQVLDSVGALGSNLLVLIPGNPQMRFGPGTFTGSVTSLTLEDSHAILDHTKGLIVAVSPSVRQPMQTAYRNKKWLTTVMGVTPDYETVNNQQVTRGRFLNAQDNESRARVALIGRTTLQNLFGSPDAVPLGESIEINRSRFTIVGVLAKKGASFMGNDQDDVVMIPLQTAMRRVMNQDYVNFMALQCAAPESMDMAAERIGYLLRRRHHLHPPFPENDDFAIRSQASLLDTIKVISGTLTALLGGIAAISLTVGGIGIMNIMLVSVTERTREIGIRKALGATQRTILQQFLVESALISLLGGVIGILLGVGLTFAVSRGFGWNPVINPASILVAIGVSASIGIFFGIWPARKAARLHPIEALRRE